MRRAGSDRERHPPSKPRLAKPPTACEGAAPTRPHNLGRPELDRRERPLRHERPAKPARASYPVALDAQHHQRSDKQKQNSSRSATSMRRAGSDRERHPPSNPGSTKLQPNARAQPPYDLTILEEQISIGASGEGASKVRRGRRYAVAKHANDARSPKANQHEKKSQISIGASGERATQDRRGRRALPSWSARTLNPTSEATN
jgi:hypothetical protein